MTRIISAMLACLLLAGCVRTLQPVLEDLQVTDQKQLAGKWLNDEGEVFQVEAGEGQALAVTYTEKDKKVGRFIVTIGKVGGLLIAQIEPDEPAEKLSGVYQAHLIPAYSFLVLDELSPKIVCRVMDYKWFETYIAAHPDELKTVKSGDSLLIVDETPRIQAFIKKHAHEKGVLADPATLTRAPADPAAKPQP